ncbi:MAG: hypothetical protein ACPHY8_01095 [Patescibacteria group bacterium]
MRVGSTLAFTSIPLTVQEAVPGKDSSHIIAVSKELSPSTVPVPICCAAYTFDNCAHDIAHTASAAKAFFVFVLFIYVYVIS